MQEPGGRSTATRGLADRLRQMIAGDLSSGEQLPTEAELAASAGEAPAAEDHPA